MKQRVYQSVSLATALLAPIFAHADPSSGEALPPEFRVNDSEPEANLPTAEQANRRPLEFGYLLVELEERAQKAAEASEWSKAVKYHRALARLVPDRAAPFSSLCRDYEQLGDRAHALAACRDALGRPGTKLEDHLRFVRIVANRPADLDAKELEDANAVIDHLRESDSTRLAAYELQCELSLRTGDRASLRECASQLERLAPEEPKNIPFSWSAAMASGDYDRARALLDQGRRKGLAPAALTRMERGLEEVRAEARDAASTSTSLTADSRHLVRWLFALLATLVVGVLLARKLARANST